MNTDYSMYRTIQSTEGHGIDVSGMTLFGQICARKLWASLGHELFFAVKQTPGLLNSRKQVYKILNPSLPKFKNRQNASILKSLVISK